MLQSFKTCRVIFVSLLLVSLCMLSSNSWGVETELLFEDFDALFDILEPAVDETGIDPTLLGWTHEPPQDWEIINISFVTGELIPGIDDPNVGVEEWEGWSFATPEFWMSADGQRRDEFTLGEGVIAVADNDEWDDLGSPSGLGTRPGDCPLCGPYHTALSTLDIDLTGVTPGSLRIEFDSSWRPELDSTNQGAILTAFYGNGSQEVLFTWDSDAGSPNFKDDNSTNEHLIYPVNNPAGADSVSFLFQMVDAGNDWWWAIDNVSVTGDKTGDVGVPCDFNNDTNCDIADIDLLNQDINAGTNTASFDLNNDGAVTLADQLEWRTIAATENGLVGPYLAGDANLDGSVNAGDLNAVGRNWQQAVALWSEGDFDASGNVDAGDLNLLGIEWQKSIPAAAAGQAVPEPTGLALLTLGGLVWALRRRRR